MDITVGMWVSEIKKNIISNHIHSNSHPQYFEFSRMKYCFLRTSWWFNSWKTSIVRYTRTSSETWLYLHQCHIIHKVFFSFILIILLGENWSISIRCIICIFHERCLKEEREGFFKGYTICKSVPLQNIFSYVIACSTDIIALSFVRVF
jgi:hypothetical protein